MFKNLPQQSLVSKIEIPKYMGKWFVIANIPTLFEKDVFNASESYKWNSEKNRIDVEYKCNRNSFTGPEMKVPQKAFVYNHKTNSEWRVQFIWPIKFAYLIVDLADDYSDTIVGVPNRKHCWIMAREPKISESRYKELVAKVKSQGYDVSQLMRVPQSEDQNFLSSNERLLDRGSGVS